MYLSQNTHPYKIKVCLHNESVIFFGKNNYINDVLRITASEQKNVLIGQGGLFSTEISIRNSDAHLLYDSVSKKRINFSKSIYIGDSCVDRTASNVIERSTYFIRGVVLGAKSVLSNKHVPSNTVWAGNPAKQIHADVFWNGKCVHGYAETLTEESKYCEKQIFIVMYKALMEFVEETGLKFRYIACAFGGGHQLTERVAIEVL